MASASAGTLQSQSSGSAIVTGEMVPSSSSSTTIVDGQLTINNFHHQQQQKSLQQSQNLLAVQQQQQHHVINLQFHDSTATPQNITGGGGIHNRHTTFVPRVGVNVSQQHLNIGNSGNRSVASDVVLNSNDNNDTHITSIRSNQVTDQIISHQQQQNLNNNLIQEHHQLSQRQSQQQQHRRQTQIMTNDANVTPEWRRLISNNEVIYVSPSGASLRNHGQIENYLLSPGTCKCGLPCPLRPEYFFDFNPQVPNIPLQIPLENGLPSRSCMFYVHQRKYMGYQQQNIIDVKKRKFSSDLSISGKLSSTSTSPTTTTQCNSVAIYSGGNVMQSSQVIPLNSNNNNNNNNKDNNNINNKNNNYNNNTNDNNNNKNNDNNKNNRMQIMSSQLVTQMEQQQQQQEIQEQLISSVAYPTAHEQKIDGSQQQQQQDHQQQQIERLSVKVDEKQIGNVMISKTPPWRKNSILQQQQVGSQSMSQLQQQQNQQVLTSSTTTESLLYLRDNSNERVPPLPQSHLCQQQQQAQSQSQQQQSTSSQVVTCGQNVTPPWQGHHNIQTRFAKTRTISSQGSTAKKKPNFRDDPTGYLDHQTAILHNSILNVVQSPDTNDNVSESDFIIGGKQISNDEIPLSRGPDLKALKTTEQGLTVMQTQNIYHHSSSEDIKSAENSKMEKINYIPNTGKYYSNSSQSVYQMQQEKGQIKSDSNYNRNLQHISSNSNQIHGQKQQQINANFPTQQIITNVSSSQPQQQISIEETSMQQYHTTDEQQQQEICRTNSLISQPTTTSIGGQTVTHFPNGMVQVEQNCDNAIVSLKPQQQIQLQQQIQQHNILFRQNQQIQKSLRKQQQLSNYQQQQLPSNNFSDQKLQIPATQGSPVPSSTTTFNRCTPDNRNTPDSKGPPQVGAISTSNDSPHPCSSPSKSPDVSQLTVKSSSVTVHNIVQPNFNKSQQQNVFATSHTTARNTITSVTAGKTITATTSVSDKPTTVNIIEPNNEIIHQSQKLSPGSIIPVSGLQLQSVVREPGNQLIMTSTGQIIVMPSQSNKSSNQVIINSPSGSNLMVNNQQSVLIQNQPNTATVMNNAQLIGNSVEVLNNQSNTSTATNLIQSPGSSLVIQNSGLVQGGQNLIQSSNNLITANSNQNFIVNSSNNMQPVILNNSNIIQQNGQNIITANAANVIQNSAPGSNVMTSGGTKVISNNIIPSNGGIIGQQTVVLNTLPNGGYVIQPNFTTVDGQMVNQIVNQESGHRTFIQQQPPQQQRQQQIILSSPDSKRRAKKRKCSAGSSPSTPSSLSPQQSPTLQAATNTAVSQSATQTQQQQGTVVQIASQYPTQGFQIGPGLQGIVVNKNTQNSAPQQQIIFQNGQIIQPVNLIGQQLLVPAGLVVTPETTTLLQIQNVASCGGIITPQGMVLRAPSPQNKSFLSPNGSGQQFIVSGNNQMSPVGQIYGAPVGLVVPQSNSGTTTFVQQNTTIVQQSPQPQTQQQQQQSAVVVSNSDSIVESHSNQVQGATSPPDTTTHSPRSPVRPPSERSRGSDMVQCVSSSEPDSVVSLADSAQSPSTTDYDDTAYQNSNKIYKSSSDTKIRQVKTPPQFTTSDISSQMKPDSHESPTNSPTTSATSTTTTSKNGNNNNNYVNNSNDSNNAISSILSGGVDNGGNNNGGCISAAGCSNSNSIIQNQLITSSYCIGELVWGAARGHPAWPGKIVNPPDGVCTPSDSTWVQWFGCRPNVELVAISSLKSLSEGLEAHHKAQKDTRKSRKLNSQLERAIQEAMTELDRMSTMPQQPSTTTTLVTTTKSSRNRGRQSSSNLNHHHQRSKPVRIAPAPPTNTIQQQQQQQQLHHTRLQSNISQQQVTTNQQQQQQQQQQEQQRTLSSTIQQQQQQNK